MTRELPRKNIFHSIRIGRLQSPKEALVASLSYGRESFTEGRSGLGQFVLIPSRRALCSVQARLRSRAFEGGSHILDHEPERQTGFRLAMPLRGRGVSPMESLGTELSGCCSWH
jgi:hypothetical protein